MNLLFFLKCVKNRNSLKKFFLFENLLFSKSYFEKYVFFYPVTHTCRPCSSEYTSPTMPMLLAQAVLIHILLLEKV